jgi:hypothetical protein
MQHDGMHISGLGHRLRGVDVIHCVLTLFLQQIKKDIVHLRRKNHEEEEEEGRKSRRRRLEGQEEQVRMRRKSTSWMKMKSELQLLGCCVCSHICCDFISN